MRSYERKEGALTRFIWTRLAFPAKRLALYNQLKAATLQPIQPCIDSCILGPGIFGAWASRFDLSQLQAACWMTTQSSSLGPDSNDGTVRWMSDRMAMPACIMNTHGVRFR